MTTTPTLDAYRQLQAVMLDTFGMMPPDVETEAEAIEVAQRVAEVGRAGTLTPEDLQRFARACADVWRETPGQE